MRALSTLLPSTRRCFFSTLRCSSAFSSSRSVAGSLGNQRFLAADLRVCFISLFLLAGVFTVSPKEKMIDASDLATTERFAKAYVQTAFDNPPGKYNYAVGIAPKLAQYRLLNYKRSSSRTACG